MTESVQQIIDGTPVEFEFDGTKYQMRQPTTAEYDDAQTVYDATAKRIRHLSDVQALADVPPDDLALFEQAIAHLSGELAQEADERRREAITARLSSLRREVESRTAQDEVVAERALLARDRFLARTLLCGADGKTFCKTPDDFERLPMGLKNAARQAVWSVWRMVDNVPFS